MSNEDLREMLREQERVLDHQIKALEAQDGKSEHMLKLCVAALAGGVALASVLLRGPYEGHPAGVLPIGVAAGLNLLALVFFVDAYVGFDRHAEGHVGPDPGWVMRKSQESDWTLEEHLLSLLADYPTYSDHNLSAMERAADLRRKGVYLLLSSAFTYAGAYVFILAEAMGV